MRALALLTLVLAPAVGNATQPTTKATMQSALHSTVWLQPYLVSPAAFRDPVNAAAIKGHLEVLTSLEHRFATDAGADAATRALAGMFGTQVQRSLDDFTTGNPEPARARLRSMTGVCFACHSRETVSQDFDDTEKTVEALRLPPLRRAELYASTRQFDRAISVWREALAQPAKTEAEWFAHTAALRQYLAVLVRVRDDRGATASVITEQAEREGVPPFFRQLLEAWFAEVRVWNADDFSARSAAPLALFKKASALIADADLERQVVADERRFISMLRATGYLYAALERAPAATWRGEALYLLAVASAATQDPLLWNLDALFLETCVREQPHSKIARRCVTRLSERTWLRWTGSGGTEIPPEELRALAWLRSLAAP
ncbi:MAG: hypothetical protein ACO1OB_22480 [Archangium sp.]